MKRKRNTVAGLLFAAFVLIWLRADELMHSMEGLLASFGEILAVIPMPFWIIIAVAFLIGTIIVSGALLIRLVRRDPPPSG